MKKITKLSWGLFNYRKLYPSLYFKDIRIFFYRVKFLLTHGYGEPARWESFNYFIDMWEDILTNYRYNRNGTPIMLSNYNPEDDEKNEKLFNDKLDLLLDKLAVMKQDPLDGKTTKESKEIANQRDTAKEEFFKEFSEIFYDLWD